MAGGGGGVRIWEDGGLIKCLAVYVSGEVGGEACGGAGMQFLKAAKATQHKLVACYLSRPYEKKSGFITLGVVRFGVTINA